MIIRFFVILGLLSPFSLRMVNFEVARFQKRFFENLKVKNVEKNF